MACHKIYKFFIISFLMMAWCVPSFAQSYVNLDLSVGMKLEGYTNKKKKGKPRCGRVSSKRVYDKLGPYLPNSKAGNGIYFDNEKKIYDLVVNPLTGSTGDSGLLGVDIKEQVRKVEVDIKTTDLAKSRVIRVELQDIVNKSGEKYQRSWNGKCSSGESVVAYSDDYIDGKISFGFQLPETSWLVRIKRIKADGIFKIVNQRGDNGLSNSIQFVDSLNPSQDQGNFGQEYLIWGLPGTKVYQEFSFEKYSEGDAIAGSFEIEFEPIPLTDYTERTPVAVMNELLASIENVRNNDEKILHMILSFIGYRERLEEIIKTARTEDLLRITKLVSVMSFMDKGLGDSRLAWDLKAAATVMSHELALGVLKELAPLCRNVALDLPGQGQSVSLLGIQAVEFFLKRALIRIDNSDYEPISALLSEIKTLENQGLSFDQVWKNEDLRRKLQKSYVLATSGFNMAMSPLVSANQEVQYVLKNYGGMAASAQSTSDISSGLKDLAQDELQFFNDLNSFLSRFRTQDTSRISSRALTEQLVNLKFGRDEIAAKMRSGSRLLSYTDFNSQSFLSVIESMYAENINILSQPLESKFEVFRSRYFNPDRVDVVASEVKSCLGDVK